MEKGLRAQITEKIHAKTIQFVWDTHVLYLQIKEYESGKRAYSISDIPEEDSDETFTYTYSKGISQSGLVKVPKTLFSIPVALGKLETNYYSKGIKSQLQASKNVINNNIQYLTYVNEILMYIEELEKDNNSEIDIDIEISK